MPTPDLDAKKADDNFNLLTVIDARDADNGYCVYFEDAESVKVPDPRPQFVDGRRVREGDPGYVKDAKMRVELTYWLPKSYNIVPRPQTKRGKIVIPADIFRVYGKMGIANSGVYGIDILREDVEDGDRLKKKTITLFYDPELLNEKAPAEKEEINTPEARKAKIAKLKQEIVDLEEKTGGAPAGASNAPAEGSPKKPATSKKKAGK